MVYYRVRPQYDNFPKNPKVRDGNILVANELYTENEFNKLPYVYAGAFERVEIPKSQTYWFFGARFGTQSFNEETVDYADLLMEQQEQM